MSEQSEAIRALEARIAQLESERGRNSLRRFRLPLSRRVLVVWLALALLVPAAALASHQFSDVPNGHTFHGAINAIALAGVTAGCGGDDYCPEDSVTRGEMAAFMLRSGARVGISDPGAPLTPSITVNAGELSSTTVPVRELTITVPGANNDFEPSQFVHVQGHVHFNTSMPSSEKGCPCEFSATVVDVTGGEVVGFGGGHTFDSSANLGSEYGFDLSGVFEAPPGAREYRLDVRLNTRTSATDPASFTLSARSGLTAMTFPFALNP